MASPKAKQTQQASIQQMLSYPPHSLIVSGEKYLVGFNTQDAKGRLEELVAASVWDRVYATAEKMRHGEQHIKRVEKLFASGNYATGGEGWREEVLCPNGAILFFLSLLQEHHPDLTAEDATKIFTADPLRCRRVITEVAPDFFQAILRQLGATEEQIQALAPELALSLESAYEEKSDTSSTNSEPTKSSSESPGG